MKKTDLALAVIARRGFAVKTVADTLGVSRSQLHSRLREGSRPRGRYQKSEDAELQTAIRTLTDDRPTYGYRRIWALLNRQREQAGQTRLNYKRIYRLMSQNGLLLLLHRQAAGTRSRWSDHHDPSEPALDVGRL
jgi:putative transposase